MPADNTAHLITAARRRRELTRAKAVRALRELGHAATPVTFEAVARKAGVSRSWLYAQPDICAEIQHLRDATARAPARTVPARQHASHASLLARLETALARNRELTSENQRLRRELAYALGERRAQPPSPGKAGPHEPIPLR
jgi:hypothetical protein